MTRRSLLTIAVLIGTSSAAVAGPHKVFSVDRVTLHILKCKPPKLQVIAYGKAPSTGWKNPQLVPYVYVKPPADGVQGFDFIADKPSGPSIPVLTPIVATHVMDIPSWLKGVRVSASTNSVEAFIKKAKVLDCPQTKLPRTSETSPKSLQDAAIEKVAKTQQRTMKALKLNAAFTRMRICAGSPVPTGWIKVNDKWSPTSCGNPTSIVYNVWIIERYDNKPVGTQMSVCASAPTPPGWVVVNKFWSPTRCGHPSAIVNNMKRIRRVN